MDIFRHDFSQYLKSLLYSVFRHIGIVDSKGVFPVSVGKERAARNESNLFLQAFF